MRPPQHLVVWLTGAGTDPPVVDDARLGTGFDLRQWFDELRPGYPEAVLGAVYAGADAAATADGEPSDWLRFAECAADVQAARGTAAFTGDTTPTSLRSLRRWVTSQLGGDRDRTDDVALVVSELATNVERHAANWLTVDLVRFDGHSLVAVTDPSVDALPLPRDVPADQVSGRGLLVVAALARWWGVVVRPASKTVWAAIPSRPAPRTDSFTDEEHTT